MKKKYLIISTSVVLIGLVSGILWWTNNPRSAYQAVFLSNNQVYFGKLSQSFSSYATLLDVYYLRVSGDLQNSLNDKTTDNQIQLVKLGSEVHGPVSKMKINKEHILFIEDLQETSPVVRAIIQKKKTETGVIAP